MNTTFRYRESFILTEPPDRPKPEILEGLFSPMRAEFTQSSALSSKNGRCCSWNKQAGRCSCDGALYATRERS